MGGFTGNLRTLRLSSTSGSRTFLSMVATSNAGAGAGGSARVYKWLAHYRGVTPQQFADFYINRFDPSKFNQLTQIQYF